MMSPSEKFSKLALSFPNSSEEPHFDRTSFRVKKKIFATLDPLTNIACLMLSPIDQSVFVLFDTTIIYPVPNKWGQKGATYVNLELVPKDMLKDALTQAYNFTVSKSGK